MKVTHSNQTLILASERRGQGAKPENTLDQAVSAASKGGVLKRVTIVATQPQGDPAGLVYVRADYSDEAAAQSNSAPAAPSTRTALVAASRSLTRTPSAGSSVSTTTELAVIPRARTRDPFGNSQSAVRDRGLSAYLKPTEQYARTQRLSPGSAPPLPLLDVLA